MLQLNWDSIESVTRLRLALSDLRSYNFGIHSWLFSLGQICCTISYQNISIVPLEPNQRFYYFNLFTQASENTNLRKEGYSAFLELVANGARPMSFHADLNAVSEHFGQLNILVYRRVFYI
jgi:hypothetical protein